MLSQEEKKELEIVVKKLQLLNEKDRIFIYGSVNALAAKEDNEKRIA